VGPEGMGEGEGEEGEGEEGEGGELGVGEEVGGGGGNSPK